MVQTGLGLQFWRNGDYVCIPMGKNGYHLFIGQTVEVVKDNHQYRLRTLRYEYRLSAGPSFDDRCLVRWEYNSREYRVSEHPRHHVQMDETIECPPSLTLDLGQIHLPSGWITIEELVRFFMTELSVRPAARNWDTLLQKSEEKFREWTARSV